MTTVSTCIQQVEALLFVSSQPVTVKQLARYAGVEENDVDQALDALRQRYAQEDCALTIVLTDTAVQLMTKPAVSSMIQTYLKEEVFGEMTKPSLETLAVIAYRGPVTKYEIDTIRGVNSSIMLRTLMVRGLIEERRAKRSQEPLYSLSIEMMRHLGVSTSTDLPRYEELHANDVIAKILEKHNVAQAAPAQV